MLSSYLGPSRASVQRNSSEAWERDGEKPSCSENTAIQEHHITSQLAVVASAGHSIKIADGEADAVVYIKEENGPFIAFGRHVGYQCQCVGNE